MYLIHVTQVHCIQYANRADQRPTEDGYHLHQAKHTLALGGWRGSLLAGDVTSERTVYRVPEPHTDSIAIILGERLGLWGLGAIGVIGVVAFPTDPGWGVVSVPGRLHPMFALLAAGSLLYVGSRLTRPRRVLLHIALFIGAGFVGGFVGGGAGFAERFALAVVGLLLYLGAYRSRVAGTLSEGR